MATKSTPTLRRTRRLHPPTGSSPASNLPHLVARLPTPIPQNANASATVVACVGDKSFHKEYEEASTSRLFCPNDTETLGDSFPSILRLTDLLNRLRQENDSAAFCNLARSFATVAADTFKFITESQFVDSTWQECVFTESIHLLATSEPTKESELQKVFECAEMVYENFGSFYRRRTFEYKPLPPSQVFQVLQPPRKTSSTRPVLKRRSGFPCLRVSNYNQRHTVLFFGEAKIPSTFSYEGPEAVEPTKGNRVQVVSVSSLVCIITSRKGATDLCLVQAVLGCFRLFITPTEFFQELKNCFELKPPTDRSHPSTSDIRANVLSVIYSWLDQHWQVDTDSVVLCRIRAFVEQQSEKDTHKQLLRSLLVKIELLERCSEEDVLAERKRCISLTTPSRTHRPNGTRFDFPETFHTSSDGLLQLDSEQGREELSRHLTIKMSHLYARLDPDKVVRFWYKQGDSCRNYDGFKDVPCVKELAAISAHGEQLTLWIISSILTISNIERRIDRISLWVDVASRCMTHCDYATAHNIYVSLSYSAIIRLKKTILMIPETTKVKYKKLDDFFKSERMFRETVDDLRPSLPCTAPLIKDIIHAKTKASSQESCASPSSKQKFFLIDGCNATQRATRVLNKALLEYRFREKKSLSRWLDDCLKEFRIIDKEGLYKKLHETSKAREPTQTNLRQFADPWKHVTSRRNYFSKRRLAGQWVNKSMSTTEKAHAFLALLKASAFR